MKNFKKIGALLFLSSYLIIGLSLSTPALALDTVNFTPQISIPGSEFQQKVSTPAGKKTRATTTSDLIARYVAAFYKWGLSIVGVLAVLMLMAGGLLWLTSGGDSGKIGQAKKMISGSLLGSLLLVGAYFFLNTINPNLTKLPAIEMENIKYQSVANGCCEKVKNGNKADMTTSSNCEDGYFYETKQLNYATRKCEEPICCFKEQVTTYNGKSYKFLTCLDILKTKCNELKAESPKNDQYNNYSYTYGYTDCSKYSKCTNTSDGITKISNKLCVGKDNGDIVTGGSYCYNEQLYIGVGSVGEPCGNENYSKCDPDKEEGGKTCNGDLGGRDCGSGLWCCKFDVSGKRINK